VVDDPSNAWEDNGPWTDLGTFGWFVGVWIVMMAAMMFPSVAPTAALYSRMSGKRLASAAFVAGYLITWTAAGVAAFLIGIVVRAVAGTSPGSTPAAI
jgi:predicted metal-binding membrane protein